MERGSERPLIELALAPLRGRDDIAALVEGVPPEAVLQYAGVVRVDVAGAVDAEADAAADPRVRRHAGELGLFLKRVRLRAEEGVEGGWLALIVADASLFADDAGLQKLEAALRPGGVVALRTTERSPELIARMVKRFANVAEVALPVEVGGTASLDYVYRGRRHAPDSGGASAGVN